MIWGGCPRKPAQALPFEQVFGNTEIVVWLFPAFHALETWRITAPQIRDRLHRIEPRSPNSRPGVMTGRIEPRSPDGLPAGTRPQWSSYVLPFGPRIHWLECALHTGRFFTSCVIRPGVHTTGSPQDPGWLLMSFSARSNRGTGL